MYFTLLGIAVLSVAIFFNYQYNLLLRLKQKIVAFYLLQKNGLHWGNIRFNIKKNEQTAKPVKFTSRSIKEQIAREIEEAAKSEDMAAMPGWRLIRI
jgi:hypothetical protein